MNSFISSLGPLLVRTYADALLLSTWSILLLGPTHSPSAESAGAVREKKRKKHDVGGTSYRTLWAGDVKVRHIDVDRSG